MSLAVLSGILVAGLYPFHAPQNHVAWLPNADGLHFARDSVVLSVGGFPAMRSDSWSLEVWLTPAFSWRRGTILMFYAPGEHRELSLRQAGRALEITATCRVTGPQHATTNIDIADVFQGGSPLLVTITADPHGASVYLDGEEAWHSSRCILAQDVAGKLILGTSPVNSDSWIGVIGGLALYNTRWTSGQVIKRLQAWRSGGDLAAVRTDRDAMYSFNERGGQLAHSDGGAGPDLYLPARYRVPDEAFLTPPWREFQATRNYLKDVLENIAGFIPLGFSFCALFLVCGVKDARRRTILLGFATSLTIEILQAFLPTRNSGVTDLFTNTLGTALGAMLYSSYPVQIILRRLALAAILN